MAKPLIVAETPNAGSLGRRYLASEEVPVGIAAGFVSFGRGADEASGTNWLAVRKSVSQRSTGRDAPCILVLAGVDAASLDSERRAAVLKKLRGFLSEVEYIAQNTDWTTEKRRVVPAQDLAALLDAELLELPPAPLKPPTDMTLWIIVGVVALLALVVGSAIAFWPKKQDKGKPDQKQEQPSKDDSPAELVKRLRYRMNIARDNRDSLEKIALEALKWKENPDFAAEIGELDKIATEARKRRAFLIKQAEDDEKANREREIQRGKDAWPDGTDRVVENLRREEKYSEAARRLGTKNPAYPEEWERLRRNLADDVVGQMKTRMKALQGNVNYDELRQSIKELMYPELLKLDEKVRKDGLAFLSEVDASEDQYRWEDIIETPEQRRREKLLAYLKSPVLKKRGKPEATARLRWHLGDWPRRVTVKVEGEATVNGKPASGGKVVVEAKKDEPFTIKSAKGEEKVSAERLMDGVEVLGVKLSVPGMPKLPKYDELPKR